MSFTQYTKEQLEAMTDEQLDQALAFVKDQYQSVWNQKNRSTIIQGILNTQIATNDLIK